MRTKTERDALILTCLDLVKRIAYKVGRGYNNDDLEGEGYLALIHAAEAYDADKGPFKPYAAQCIKHKMWLFISQDYPVNVRGGKSGKMPETMPKFNGKFEHLASDSEQVEFSGDLARMSDLSGLTDREAASIRGHFGFDGKEKSLREIAGTTGVSYTWVSEDIKKGLRKLRERLS
jgi:RNA polymerase sporulation-specific sigma factor